MAHRTAVVQAPEPSRVAASFGHTHERDSPVLVDGRTPVNYTMFAPVTRRCARSAGALHVRRERRARACTRDIRRRRAGCPFRRPCAPPRSAVRRLHRLGLHVDPASQRPCRIQMFMASAASTGSTRRPNRCAGGIDCFSSIAAGWPTSSKPARSTQTARRSGSWACRKSIAWWTVDSPRRRPRHSGWIRAADRPVRADMVARIVAECMGET